MTTVVRELVQRNHRRLVGEHKAAVERGAISNSKNPFHEYFNGKVLLNADDTLKVKQSLLRGASAEALVTEIYDELLETGEKRFVPSLTLTKEDRRLVVIVSIIKT